MAEFQFKTEPYQHQKSMLRYHVCRSNSAEFSDFGTGKSKVALDLIRWRVSRKDIDKSIILAPANVLPNWEQEIKLHTDLDYSIGEIGRRVPTITVLSYDGLRATGGTKKNPLQKNDRLKMALALARKWRTQVIFDESTKIKNLKAARTKAAILLSDSCLYHLIMTGVPIPNNLQDIWAQFRVVDSNLMGENFYRWRAIYFYRRKWDPPGVWHPREKTLAYVKGMIQAYGIRFDRDDCLDLPDATYGIRWVELTKEQQQALERTKYDSTFSLGGHTIDLSLPIVRFTKRYEIAQGFVYLDKERKNTYQFPNNPKTKLVKELCEDWIAGDTKAVIYTAFRQQRDELNSELANFKPTDQMIPFQEDPARQLFIDHVSQGIGVTLHRANITIYTSNTFSLEDRIQSEARIRRIGQKKKQHYIDILAKDCDVEDRVYDCIRQKKDIHEEVTRWENIYKEREKK